MTEAWPAVVQSLVVGHHGVQELGAVSQVSASWHVAAAFAASRALIWNVFNPLSLFTSLGYSPPETRIQHIIEKAADDLVIMDKEAFRNVVAIQLALQHVRSGTPPPHRVTLNRVINVLVAAVGRQLSAAHPLVVEAIALLEIPEAHLKADVGNLLPQLQKMWRRAIVDPVCIGTLLQSLSSMIVGEFILSSLLD